MHIKCKDISKFFIIHAILGMYMYVFMLLKKWNDMIVPEYFISISE